LKELTFSKLYAMERAPVHFPDGDARWNTFIQSLTVDSAVSYRRTMNKYQEWILVQPPGMNPFLLAVIR
jgi:hypothetical protein